MKKKANKIVDLSTFLVGVWRRNLEVRHFGGGYEPLRPTNSFVVIEDSVDAAPEPNTRFLNWKYTNSSVIDDNLQTWLCMQFVPMHDGRTLMEWVWKSHDDQGEVQSHVCNGCYDPAASVFTLNFDVPGQSVVYTYRIIDPMTIAVCVVTVTSQELPRIQYGHMIRLPPES